MLLCGGLLECHARAEEPETSLADLRATSRADPGLRLRFGIGATTGGIVARDAYASNGVPIVGFDLRLGAQLSDWCAVVSQFGFAFFDTRGALLFELTPSRFLTFGVGAGFDSFAPVGPSEGQNNAVMFPIRAAFNMPVGSPSDRRREAISIALNAAPSEVFTGLPARSGDRFGLALYGGVGFEMY